MLSLFTHTETWPRSGSVQGSVQQPGVSSGRLGLLHLAVGLLQVGLMDGTDAVLGHAARPKVDDNTSTRSPACV